MSTTDPALNGSPTSLSTIVVSLTSTLGPTSTSTQSGLPTNPNSGQQRNTSPTQNYLFFIALALGIVFVNLWIILGIRFLYRRRQRQRALADPENQGPDPMIPMIARGMVMTGGHPRARQRRKRQKKVVSLAFLDDNFPATRYADWKNGTYTNEKSVDEKVVEKEISTERNMTEKEMDALSDENEHDTANHTTIVVEEDLGSVGLVSLSNSAGASALSLTQTNSRTPTDDRVEPPSDPDTCAICIEQLEDCDEIRVLKCNHVFHFSCITPWMTNRNASCPLCKTLYYIPPPPPMPDWLANVNGQVPTPTVNIEARGVSTAGSGALASSGSDDSPSSATSEVQAVPHPPPAARASSRLSRFKRVMRLN